MTIYDPKLKQKQRQRSFILESRLVDYALLLPVLLFLILGWSIVIVEVQELPQTITAAYQQAELEIVRSVARNIKIYVQNEITNHNQTDITELEQEILARFITPIHLFEQGDAWIYTPDYVVFDQSADFPAEYRGKNMAEIFAIQSRRGASHYEEMSEAVGQAREGVGWYIWLPDKGPEIAAWTPVQVGEYTWIIGLSTPLREILAATGATGQMYTLLVVMGLGTLAALGLLLTWGYSLRQRRQAGQALRDSEEKYRTLAENLPDVIMRFDRQNRYIYVNPAVTRFVNLSPADFLGKSYQDLNFPVDQAAYWEENIQQVFETGRPHELQVEFMGIHGPVVFEWRLRPELDKDGRVESVLTVAHDITERRRAETGLQERIIALTQPLGDTSTLKFEDLFNLAEIQAIQDAFAAATGVASIITDAEGWPITQASNFCRLCTEIIRTTPAGLANCMRSDAIIGGPNPAGPTIQPCLSGGLINAGASIMVGDHHVANWLIGQVLDGEPDEATMMAYAHQIGADEQEFRHALAQVTRMPRSQFNQVSQALFLIAGQLSKLAVQNVQQARDIARRQEAEVVAALHREALRRERDLVTQIMETSPVGITLLNPAGQITFANRRAEQILGLTRSEILQRVYNAPEWRITGLAGQPFPAEALPFRRVLELGQPVYDVEHAIEWSDGRRVLLSVNAAPLSAPTGGLTGIVATIEDITDWRQAQESLRRSEERYRLLFDEMLDGFALHEIICNEAGQPVDYRFLEVNPAFEKLTGLPAEDLIGQTVLQVLPNVEPFWIECYGQVSLTGQPTHFENYTLSLDKDYEVTAFSPQPGQFAVIIADVTDRRRAEAEKDKLQAQLRQAQKMEAVGQLAGGIAHDFNNILTAIMGYTDLSLAALPPDHPSYPDLQGIQKSAQRAALLTRQLLAFARRQVNQPQTLNLNELIFNMIPMLRRLIGEHIEVVTLLEPDLGWTRVDPHQFEQVLLNLVVNARDAMPGGGKVTIETQNMNLDVTYTNQYAEVKPGRYVLLMVSDTGVGMTEEVRGHLFEPFFTTKEVGQGTGLGLATCFGIVKQHDGHIWVYSEPGQGTTFKVYLPRVEIVAETALPPHETDDLPRGVETILLVEDEPAVREMVARILHQQGYTVLEASNGAAALQLVETLTGEPIDLLVTDMVMPLLGGQELAEQLQARWLRLKVLFMSGYTDSTVVQENPLKPGVAYLPKPFATKILAYQVRQLLDQPL